MKTKILLIVTFVIWILSGIPLIAQHLLKTESSEHLTFFTDRTLFITGEQVSFSAYLKNDSDQNIQIQSQVLYLEIISPNGDKIAAAKYPIFNSISSGSLLIPKDIPSGNYYMRAYTKFMRNFGPEAYSYLMLKIINPVKKDILPGNETKPQNNNSELDSKPSLTNLSLETDKQVYSKRSLVKVNLSIPYNLQSELTNVCFSVIPEMAIDQISSNTKGKSESATIQLYYPENRGVSITGKLLNKNTSEPLIGKRVNLSIIGGGKDFMAVRTDSSGEFYFPLPNLIGKKDIFLCSENIPESAPSILIDNDFCSVPVHLPAIKFTLSDKEANLALNLAENKQLSSTFKLDSISSVKEKYDYPAAFYGTPSQTLLLDDYVQLPSLEEYFNELPTLVRIRKQHGKKYFKIFSSQEDMQIYDPLVLIDFVAIDNPEKILAVSPTGISRIEIVNVPYVKGDITYDGIISIISRKSDFAGIDLPKSGIFINYNFFHDDRKFIPQNNSFPNIPDTRNTLYWEPSLELKSAKLNEISFSTSDMSGRYVVLIRGIESNGTVISKSAGFEVK